MSTHAARFGLKFSAQHSKLPRESQNRRVRDVSMSKRRVAFSFFWFKQPLSYLSQAFP